MENGGVRSRESFMRKEAVLSRLGIIFHNMDFPAVTVLEIFLVNY